MASFLGLPEITINFSSRATSAITRSSRGIVSVILNDENVSDEDGVKYKLIEDSSDIPSSGIESRNIDLLNKALQGTPLKVHAYFIPPATHEEEQVQTRTETRVVDSDVIVTRTVDSDVVVTHTVDSDVVVTNPDTGETDTQTISVTYTDTEVQSVTYTDVEVQQVTITDTIVETVTVMVDATITQADALKKCANLKFNYICHPTGSSADQQSLASWVSSQRANRHKVFKAVVANYAANNYGVINFTTGGIKVDNPAYIAALAEVDGDESAVDANIPQYLTYSAKEYTARIAGILAGLSLDRSATYYTIAEVVDVDAYDDIDSHINSGELCLFDEKDGSGVKIARGCNSLTTFTTTVGEDFRFIKIVEALDLIKEDIVETFRNDYVGKVVNTYNNKQLLVAAINSYLTSLQGNVLDPSGTNSVEIDLKKNAEYAKAHGSDISSMSSQRIREFNTGTYVYLAGSITPVNSMEDLQLDFVLS